MKKTRLKNYLKTVILYAGMLFLLCNCENENSNLPETQQGSIETVALNEAIALFNAKTIPDANKAGQEAYATPHLEDISQEEITNTNALLTVIPATTMYGNHYSRILLLKINNEIQSLVFSMYASDGVSQAYFSGEIIITDLDGNFINGYRVANGLITSQLKKASTNAKAFTAAKNNNVVCPDHGECTEGSNCVLCLQELEEVVVGAGSGNSGGQVQYVDLNDFPGIDEGGADGPDMGLDWDYGPGEGASPDDNNAEENIVIDPQFSQDYPCQSDIVQQAYGLCSPLTQLILDIFEANEGTNLVYKSFSDAQMQSAGSEITAYTNTVYFYNPVTHTCDVTVRIRESYLETATDLSIVRTVLHESLHATFVYMLEEGLLTLPDGTADPDFADLVNAHLDYISDLPANLNKAHHELMVSFVGDIATSLSEYGQQNGYNLSPQFYNDMAWAGLTHIKDEYGNLVINSLFTEAVPNADDRDRIINRLAAEAANQTVGAQTPSGQPCTH